MIPDRFTIGKGETVHTGICCAQSRKGSHMHAVGKHARITCQRCIKLERLRANRRAYQSRGIAWHKACALASEPR